MATENNNSTLAVFDEESIAVNESAPVVLKSISGSAYHGTISSTYLDYFNGVLDRLNPSVNYLIYRPDRYNVTLVYSDALEESGGTFSASEASYINIYSYNDYEVSRGTDSVNVSVGNAMVYSNLAGYPVSLKGETHAESFTLFFVVVVMLLFNVIRGIFSMR